MDGIYTSCDPNIIWYATSCETWCNVKMSPSTPAVPRISLGLFLGLIGAMHERLNGLNGLSPLCSPTLIWGWACWQDEDFIGQCSRISRSCHPLLASTRTIQKVLSLYWQQLSKMHWWMQRTWQKKIKRGKKSVDIAESAVFCKQGEKANEAKYIAFWRLQACITFYNLVLFHNILHLFPLPSNLE